MLNLSEPGALIRWISTLESLVVMPQSPMAIVCIDESGKFSDTEVVCLAACMVAAEDAGGLTQKWSARLKSDNLKYTSMKEALNFHGPFESWRPITSELEQKRDTLLWDLAEIIASAPMNRIAVTVTSEKFKQLTGAQRKKLGNDPWYAAFEACIIGCLNGNRYNVAIHADLSEEYSEKCVKLFNLLRARRPDLRDAIFAITFMDDTAMPLVQMADMVSYCGRADATQTKPNRNPIVDRIINLFHSQDSEHARPFYWESGNGLGELQLDSAVPLQQ